MNEETPTRGKMLPAALIGKTINSNNEVTANIPQQMECPLENPEKSLPMKRKPSAEPSMEESAHTFEAAAAGACAELRMLVSTFAEVVSEKAAADTCQMRALEGILTEAQNIESHLRKKKNHVKQILAVISDKLHS